MGSSGTPATVKSSTGTFSVGGQPLATSTLGKNGYSTNINLSPDQQSTWDTSNAGTANTLGSISSILGTAQDPNNIAKYTQQLYGPQAQQITQNYNTAKDAAYSRFGSMGGLNSAGFNRYNDNILTRNENQDLASAYNTASTQAYQLPNIMLQPIQTALSLYGGAQSNLFNQALASAGQSSTGQQLSNQYNTANNIYDSTAGKTGIGGKYMNFIDPLKLMH